MDIAAIGRQFGLNDAQTRAALDALAPVVAAGVRRTAQTPEGLQEIFKSVLTGGYGRALDDEQAISPGRAKPAGDEILGQIFGSKEASRELAQRVSETSGIGTAVLKKLLPVVAMIVMGGVANKIGVGRARADTGAVPGQKPQADSGGGLGDILKDIFGGGQPTQRAPQPVPSPQGQRSGSSAPQPVPSPQGQRSGNPLEDILSDILSGGANGGRVVVKQIPPDQMGDILRDIFGRNAPSGAGEAGAQPEPPRESITRGRNILEDILGRGTKTGNTADDLLSSVRDAISRRL
jgi:hypothetical protein